MSYMDMSILYKICLIFTKACRELLLPSLEYPSAHPQVSTLTNCNSMDFITASQCSIITYKFV